MTDTRQEMRDWLAAELDKHPRGVKGQLAKALGVRADAIGRMLNTDPGKETRDIKAHEFLKMQEFFLELTKEEPEPQKAARPPITEEAEVRSMLERIPGLLENDIAYVLKGIRNSLIANGGEPLQTQSQDQSHSATPHQEEDPSRRKAPQSAS